MGHVLVWLALAGWHGAGLSPMRRRMPAITAQVDLSPPQPPAEAPALAPVQFMPSFKAASRAHGVVRRGNEHIAEYEVSHGTTGVEVRAMLHWLSRTGQLEPAARVLEQYIQIAPRADEHLASIVLNSCADKGRMDLYAAARLCAHMGTRMNARAGPRSRRTGSGRRASPRLALLALAPTARVPLLPPAAARTCCARCGSGPSRWARSRTAS